MPHVKPMVVAIWSGEGKPSSCNDYLKPFVDELLLLLENGIDINGHKIYILIGCFICDSPARAFIKCKYLFVEMNSNQHSNQIFFQPLSISTINLDVKNV